MTSSPAVANGVVYIARFWRQRVRAERQHRRLAVELSSTGLNGLVLPRPPSWMGWFTSVLELRWFRSGQGHVYAFALVGPEPTLFLRVNLSDGGPSGRLAHLYVSGMEPGTR